MDNYLPILGMSDGGQIDILQVNTLLVQKDLTALGTTSLTNLQIPTGAIIHDVLTCVSGQGDAQWQPPADAILGGDCTGTSSSNQVNTLAGGTIAVADLVTKNGTQTLSNKTFSNNTTFVNGTTISNINTAWINLPTSGPCGIGTNNGNIPWWAYCTTAGQWMSDANAGDYISRNTAGSILLSTNVSSSQLSIKPAGVYLGSLLLKPSGTGAITFPAVTDTAVTLAAVQTLTNKTLMGTTNDVEANRIRSGSAWSLALSGFIPNVNDVLTYDGTNAGWSPLPVVAAANLVGDVTSVGTYTTAVRASMDFSVNRILGYSGAYAGAKMLALFDSGTTNDPTLHNFTGLGVGINTMRYQLPSSTMNHTFYAAFSPTASTTLMNIAGTGAVTIPGSLAVTGIHTQTGTLTFGTNVLTKLLSLYDPNPGDQSRHDFGGFGTGGGLIRYHGSNTTVDHTFYAGTSATTSNELMRIRGAGGVLIPSTLGVTGAVSAGSLDVTGAATSGTLAVTGAATIGTTLAVTGITSLQKTLTWNGASYASKMISLYDLAPSDQTRTDFYGIGMQSTKLIYQVDSTSANHVFQAGTGTTTSNTLMNIGGNGAVNIPGSLTLSSGSTPLNYYEVYNHNTTFSCGTYTSAVMTICFTKVGRMVNITMNNTYSGSGGTPNPSFSNNTLLPTRFQPFASGTGIAYIVNNGAATSFGTILISGAVINIYGGAGTTPFTGSGGIAFGSSSFSYCGV